MNLKLKGAALISVSLFLAACNSTQNGYSGNHPVQRTNDSELNTIVFIDHDLNRTDLNKTLFGTNVKTTVKVTIDRSGMSRTDTGNLEVWTVLRNRTDYDLQVEGKAIFFDASTKPLHDESNWRRVYIPANGTATYSETSLNSQAANFVVELREGR
ncbi:DUF1425 domain-containing protein [Shewanella acanthi]|uniref:DUF1425 domain-containing protein n=1 Tax=Shewanella acanthi TaxID=2864212 RepID=UPI001C660267|nr:DUF1425 domain-containing protein [Shewanella acanthi]QYJ78937.1 hypothetical protein K0H61_00285 [Shewanella acanthi]